MKNRKTFAVIAASAGMTCLSIFLFILKDIAHFYPAQSIVNLYNEYVSSTAGTNSRSILTHILENEYKNKNVSVDEDTDQ